MLTSTKPYKDIIANLPTNSNYNDNYPSKENALSLFQGEWISKIPVDNFVSGDVELFKDARIDWLLDNIENVQNMHILELGPFEAGHTSILHEAGAKSILAIEANIIAFMKCLVVKEVLNLNKAEFRLGNFEKFIDDNDHEFDLIVASGVLYHLTDPLLTLLKLMKMSRKIFIWSHFFNDQTMPIGDPRRAPFTGEIIERNIDGYKMRYHVRSYGGTEQPRVFCGGIYSGSVWVELQEVEQILQQHGFKTTINFDHPGHMSGPCACILALR